MKIDRDAETVHKSVSIPNMPSIRARKRYKSKAVHLYTDISVDLAEAIDLVEVLTEDCNDVMTHTLEDVLFQETKRLLTMDIWRDKGGPLYVRGYSVKMIAYIKFWESNGKTYVETEKDLYRLI